MVSYRRRDEDDKKEPEHVDLRGAKPFRNAYEEKERRENERKEAEKRAEEERQTKVHIAQAQLNRGVPTASNYPIGSGFTKIAKAREEAERPGLGSKILSKVSHGLANTIGVSPEARADRARVNQIKDEGEEIRKAAAKKSYFKGMYELGDKQGREIALKPKETIKSRLEKATTIATKRLNETQRQAFSDSDFLGLAGYRRSAAPGSRIPVREAVREDIFGNPIQPQSPNVRTIVTRDSFGRPVKVQERIQKIEYKHGKEIITYRKVPVKKKANQGFDPFGF